MRYMLKTAELFDLAHSLAGEYLAKTCYPYEALAHISEWIVAIGERLPPSRYEKKGDGLWIARTARLAPTVSITGPCIVGEEAELRHCAFVRGGALIGRGCVVGNSTELKNCILFDRAQVPHFNYVGDSILGARSHFGAGVITANVRADRKDVALHTPDGKIDTGRYKVGAMVGDGAEIGCGAVLAPGAVVGRESIVYPLSLVRGCVPSHAILKSDKSIIKRE